MLGSDRLVLGLGVQPPRPAWGSMLSLARSYTELAPWLAIFPGLVDGLVVQGLESKAAAVILGEALRLGATRILEMDADDLQILTFPTEAGRWDLFVYDPMPGGSGLLSQILERWKEVRDRALESVVGFPGACERSCYLCLRSYGNLAHHGLLEGDPRKSEPAMG